MVTVSEHTVANKYGSTMRVKSVKVHDKLPKGNDPEPEQTIVEAAKPVSHTTAMSIKKPVAGAASSKQEESPETPQPKSKTAADKISGNEEKVTLIPAKEEGPQPGRVVCEYQEIISGHQDPQVIKVSPTKPLPGPPQSLMEPASTPAPVAPVTQLPSAPPASVTQGNSAPPAPVTAVQTYSTFLRKPSRS